MSLLQNYMMAGAASAPAAIDYTIDNSCRFNSADTSYMSRTYGTGGNQDLWTLSFWLKRCKFATDTYVFGSGADSNNTFDVLFNTSDQLRVLNYAGAFQTNLITTQVFRDTSAWYHFIVVYDSAQSTAANRVNVYVNGSEITAYDTETYPDQNGDSIVGSNTEIGFGRYISNGSAPADIYLSECNFINGSAESFTEFGETNSDGVWVPKEYGGSYGTGGFFLDFKSSGDLGNDASSNNNDMTTSGLAAADQMEDTPTNNHCTWNPLNKSTSSTLLDGNLHAVGNGTGDWFPIIGTQAMESGKWYIEFEVLNTDSIVLGVGNSAEASRIAGASFNNVVAGWTHIAGYEDGASYRLDNGDLMKLGEAVDTGWGDTYTIGDIIGIAIDADTGSVWFAKNNTWQASGDPAAGTNTAATGITTPMTIFCGFYYITGAAMMRSAEGDWSYTAPSGFNAINTTNIAAPAVTDPSAQFQTELYTGNGTAIGSGGKAITFTGNSSMQPDFVWIKNRDATDSHGLYDAVRGTTKQIESDDTSAETTETEGLTTFGSDGFTVGSLAQVNTSTEDYVSWNWKEGTTPGFDIVTYTGNGSNRTISHNLGVVPKMIIVKNRSATDAWKVYHAGVASDPETDYLVLNTTAAPVDDATVWNDTAPTSSVFSIGTHTDVNTNTETYVAYLWADIEGFSKLGTYEGNAATDGSYVYCGFKPALVITKSIDSTSVWGMYDNNREGYNPDNAVLHADATTAEGVGTDIDFLANSFKLRVASDPNVAETYIFAAWAETPFGGSDVAPAPAR